MNRKDENTENARPDGVLKLVNQKTSNVTLGFCEVKPSDCTKSSLLCTDLLRLGTFSKKVMLRKENKTSVCIQAIGKAAEHIYIYVFI